MNRTGSEKVYGILRWIALLSIAVIPSVIFLTFFGIGLIFLLEKTLWPEWLKTVLMVLFWLAGYGFAVELGRRGLIRKDAQEGIVDFSRAQSAGLWLVPGFLLCLLSVFLWRHCGNSCFLAAIPVLIAAAFALGWFFPFRKHVNGPVFGCLGPLMALLIFGFGAVLIGRSGRQVDYTGNRIADIPHLNDWQRKNYFPEGCTEIRVKGSTVFFEWECRLSEQDFLRYKKNTPFNFRKCDQPLPGTPVPYYEYERRASDGGGVKLRYSVPERKFYGSYVY